ncbi:hypothetical protein ACLMJK_005698 [Lecanora helva]
MHHRLAQLLALAVASHITTSSASPLDVRATAVKCNDVTTGLDPNCWSQLNMTTWFKNWEANTPGANSAQGSASTEDPVDPPANPAQPQTSPGVAGGFGNGGDIGYRRRAVGCQKGEKWSTCFLRLGLGKAGEDCTKIGPQTCVPPQVGKPPQSPEVYYGLWNIYAVNNYITTVYDALQDLARSNPDTIRSIATGSGDATVDFSNGKTYDVNGVLVEILLKETNGRQLINAINTPLITYLENAKSKNKYGPTTGVDQLTSWMSYSLTDALKYVMTDLPAFVKFVDNGAFSTKALPKKADLVKAFAA